MAIPASRNTRVKAWLVNCAPWSVLKISGLPCRASASSSASTRDLGLQGDRQPPREDPAAEPVDDGGQVDEATRHRNVGDVHGPDLVGSINRQPAQEIRVDLVPWRGLRGARFSVERLDPQALHQRRDMAAPDRDALLVQEIRTSPRWARSTSRGGTRWPSSSGSAPTRSARCRSARPATRSCCARTASSWTTAPSRGWARATRHDGLDGECREGDAAPRVLPSVAVAGPRRADRLDQRAMGPVRRGRPARPRHAAGRHRSRVRHRQRGLPVPGLRRGHGRRRDPARLFRISFFGELAYGLAVPAAYGDAAWRAIMQAGSQHGIRPTAPRRSR